MRVADILAEHDVLSALGATTAEAALAEVCAHLARTHALDAAAVCATLLDRERLGSTGIGGGVAIPHGKVAGLAAPIGCLARSATGVPFGALDEVPVTLLFVLLAPDSAELHLKALARVAAALRSADLRAALRQAPDSQAMHAAFLAVEVARP